MDTAALRDPSDRGPLASGSVPMLVQVCTLGCMLTLASISCVSGGARRAHDHSVAPHGGALGMAGDLHLELVAAGNGAFRLYLLDSFMEVRPVDGVQGTVEDSTKTTDLTVGPGGRYLTAENYLLAPGESELTFELRIGSEELSMSLPVLRPAPGVDDEGGHEHISGSPQHGH